MDNTKPVVSIDSFIITSKSVSEFYPLEFKGILILTAMVVHRTQLN